MQKSSKIVFFGNERLSSGFTPEGAPTLEKLIAHGYTIACVVVNYEAPTSRKARPLEIAAVAKKYNIPLLAPNSLKDIYDTLMDFKADVGVLVAYGKIVPQSLIDIFPHGILNIHPSLLPQYRGPTPIEQAILDGATETGVSVMQLVKAMDAGPIYAQTKILLTGNERKHELTAALLQKGSDLILDVLPNVLNNKTQPIAQDESKATYSRLFQKEDGYLDAASKTASQLEREIRAYAIWPKSRLEIAGNTIIALEARVVTNNALKGALILPCAQNTYLEITRLTAPSGRQMSGEDFLRGIQNKNS